ncbi:MAG TPA: hypothetical protein VN408_03355 [Actinoplanes sp.]|nr:hypothetical protein [Actinoplanes sp.]
MADDEITSWEEMLTKILGAAIKSGEVAITRADVAGLGVRWVEFEESWTKKYGQKSLPEPAENEIVGYRPTGEWDNPNAGNPYASSYSSGRRVEYQIVRAKVVFDQDPGSGGVSPASAYQAFQSAGESAIRTFDHSGPDSFRWTSLDSANDSVYAVEYWLDETKKTLKGLIDSIDDEASGFKGSASAVLRTALDNAHNDMRKLAIDMKVGDQTVAWSVLMNRVRDAMKTFGTAVSQAWDEYHGGTVAAPAPIELINGVRGIVAGLGSGNFENVSFSSVNNELYTYDLTTELGWERLDSDMKTLWLKRVGALDTKMLTALTALETMLKEAKTAFGRDLVKPKPRSPETPDPEITDANGDGIPDGYDPAKDGSYGGGSTGDYDVNPGTSSDFDPSSFASGKTGADSGTGAYGVTTGGGASGYDFGGSGYTVGGSGYNAGGSGYNAGGSYDAASGYNPVTGGSGGVPSSGWGSISSPVINPLPGSLTGLGNLISGAMGGSGSHGAGSSGTKYPGATGSMGGSGKTGAAGSWATGADTASHYPTAVDSVDVGDLGGSAGSAGGAGSNGVNLGDGVSSLLDGSGAGGASTKSATDGTTSSGMPFMPPMGGMGGASGGQQGQKERERKTWLEEDEEVWGADPDCAPAVLGRGPAPDPSSTPTGRPVTAPRRPAQPSSPARGTSRGRG